MMQWVLRWETLLTCLRVLAAIRKNLSMLTGHPCAGWLVARAVTVLHIYIYMITINAVMMHWIPLWLCEVQSAMHKMSQQYNDWIYWCITYLTQSLPLLGIHTHNPSPSPHTHTYTIWQPFASLTLPFFLHPHPPFPKYHQSASEDVFHFKSSSDIRKQKAWQLLIWNQTKPRVLVHNDQTSGS